MTLEFKHAIGDTVYFATYIGHQITRPENTKIQEGVVSKIEVNEYWQSYQMDYTQFDRDTISLMVKEAEVFKTREDAEDFVLGKFKKLLKD